MAVDLVASCECVGEIVSDMTSSIDVLLAGGAMGVHQPVQHQPVALRLIDLPIIRAVQKLENPEDAEGRLPIQAYTAVLEGHRQDGSKYSIIVKGDDHHGLPYGSDGDIFFALFRIADELPLEEKAHLLDTGEFHDPTVGRIARAMGRPINGETTRRIRGALHRLSHVRIEMQVTHPSAAVGAALLSGEGTAHPMDPDGAPVPRGRKGTDTVGVLYVLEYIVSRAYDRRPDGEDWIAHLQLNPIWLRELAGGWAAWIDVDRYIALRSPIAKRLYQLFAGESARGVRVPWVVGLTELQGRCGMIGLARRPAAVKGSIEEAAAELVAAEILASAESRKTGAGRYEFTFAPGPQLHIAALLRGVGALDPRESRVQRMLLRYFGVTRELADRMLGERPNRVYEALQYLLYLRDTDHTRVKRSWAAYLVKLVDGDANFAGDVKFQDWLVRHRRQIAVPSPAVLPVGAALSAPLAEERMPAADVSRTAVRSSSATELWNAVRGRAAARYGPTHSAYVEDLVAFDLADSMLTCVAASDFAARKLEAVGLGLIEDELRVATEGQVTTLRVEPFRLERHAAEYGTVAEHTPPVPSQ